MDVEGLYERLLPTCTTVNQVNRLLIDLDNRMTPREADRLIRHVLRRRRRRLPLLRRSAPHPVSDGSSTVDAHEQAVAWAQKARRLLSHGPAPARIPTVRAWARRGAAMYRAQEQPSDVLVIGFSGNMRRLMLPTPVALQQLAPFHVDLLLLWSRSGTAFRSGIAGHGSTLPGVAAWLREEIDRHGASTIVVMGTSAGAFPAVLVAHALGVTSVLAAGTRVSAPETYWPDAPSSRISEVVAAAANGAAANGAAANAAGANGAPPAVHLVFGADSEADATDAHRVAEAVARAHLTPVPEAGHSCLAPLLQRGQLRDVLATTLLAGVRSPRG